VHQATILHARDDFADASVLLKEAEKIAGKKKDKNILASCYYTQALVARESRDLVRAATLFRKAQQFYRELNNREELERCTRQLKSLPGTTEPEHTPAPARAERTDQMGFLDKIKEIFRSGPKRDPEAEAVALGQKVMALKAAGDFSKAGAMLEDVVKLFREARDTAGLCNCAQFYAEMSWGSEAKGGQSALSVAFAQRGEKLAREVGCTEGLIEGLRYQVYCLLVNEKKPAAALPLAEEAYRLAQQSGSDLTGMLAEMLNFARQGTGQL
jgi:tetratricopeptide (TPR) repeat protein